MQLAKSLHEAVKEGLTDFTVYRVSNGWQASSRWRQSTGWRVNIDKDLETALLAAVSTQRIIPDTEVGDLA